MTNKHRPLKGLNIKIPIIILMKGMGFISYGSIFMTAFRIIPEALEAHTWVKGSGFWGLGDSCATSILWCRVWFRQGLRNRFLAKSLPSTGHILPSSMVRSLDTSNVHA